MPVVQLNTGNGFGGECHLDANMVRSAIDQLPLYEIDLLVIENVGNLVCPAEFRVGEDARAMVCSVTEGEDKPLKYPLMFRACELVVINKIDLLPHLDFDLDRLLYHLDAVNPGARRCSSAPAPARGSTSARLARGARRARPRRACDGAPPRSARSPSRAWSERREAGAASSATQTDPAGRPLPPRWPSASPAAGG